MIRLHQGHDHAGEHHHESMSKEQLISLLNYMLDHNRHHADELSDFAHALSHLGKEEEAKLLLEGVADFETGNRKLAAVLEKLR